MLFSQRLESTLESIMSNSHRVKAGASVVVVEWRRTLVRKSGNSSLLFVRTVVPRMLKPRLWSIEARFAKTWNREVDC